ncbi:hypothetical protein FAD_0879 [Ferroplasma acidiphilum]|uniref:Uncharacterized protein n=2 Tax=Ferroplasma acidiphilum TaxID=74969 RepID=A0A1V0N3P8_9ARCH|nr:hypothetical protein FAD_0879 [Ferroplasma acidiphilum]
MSIMKKIRIIRPEFVEFIPDDIKEGVLYISIRYNTATHRCPSGCGEIVVTPITPTDWTLIWNGESVSLYPSIGNWSLPCESHYWIRENRIVWARKWNIQEIEFAKDIDDSNKAYYFKHKKKNLDKVDKNRLK